MASFFESIFEFLFKYRPVVFEQGELGFDTSQGVRVVVLIGAVIALAALLTYVRARARSGRGDRIVLIGLRAMALLVVLICLFRPMMVLSAAVAQRNVVGILLDDSRSMQIPDMGAANATRADFIRRVFGRDSALVTAIADRFIVRFFRFSTSADRVGGPQELSYTGTGTRLGPSLERARQDLAGVPLSGLVLASDGADNSSGALAEELQSLSAWSVPVFTVGIGREHFSKDVQVDRVEIPRTALKGSLLTVDVVITQSGFAGAKVPLVVEDSGRIVVSQEITLPSNGEASIIRVNVPTKAAGTRLFTFRVPVQDGEVVLRNNERGALVRVRDTKERVLYIEGEPRYEMKFTRRAIASDTNIQLVTLQRTAEGKFLRLSVNDSSELANGFPTTRKELFGYRAVVIGSIEASFFSLEQLRMLADFVSDRGGTLLMLGGRHSLGEGGYGGTALSDVLPITLDESAANDKNACVTGLTVKPTDAGASHAVTQVAGTAVASTERWKTLPPLTSVNRPGRAKPGAVTLLTGTRINRDCPGAEDQAVLAYQRFGRGTLIVLPVQDTWLWQMHADIPVEDMTHETFWRQMLRWLVSDVPDQVTVTTLADRVDPGAPIVLRADVRDSTYTKATDARVVAHVRDGDGKLHDVPMDWTADGDGQYRATFTPATKGIHEIRVEAKLTTGATPPEAVAYIESAELNTEYFDAGMRSSLLRRVARETGGRYYTPETVSSLPKDIVFTRAGTTAIEKMDLWDMPIVFLVLLSLVAAEWVYRRKRGLA